MIVPALHRILVKADRLENVDKTHVMAKKAGIFIPESADKARAQAGVDKGVVVAIGPTAFRDFNTVSPIKVGSYIAYARFAGKTVEDPYTEEEFVCLNDEDVVCVFQQE
jgi:co-chaperonin GroES (HSP10)